MATKKIEDLPPRPAIITESCVLRMKPRPEGLEAIQPLVGLDMGNEAPALEEQLEARAARYAKIKAAGGGDFRVIHGNMRLPRPREEWQNADGSRKENVDTCITLTPGDLVRLNVDDAFRALEQGLVEELDAKPSRVNKVFTPPKVVQQFSGHPVTLPAKTSESRP